MSNALVPRSFDFLGCQVAKATDEKQYRYVLLDRALSTYNLRCLEALNSDSAGLSVPALSKSAAFSHTSATPAAPPDRGHRPIRVRPIY